MRFGRTSGLCVLIALLAAGRSAWCDDIGKPRPAKERQDEEHFRWRKAIWESFFSIAIDNGFRFATQADTRQAIQGPFWANYAESIENLHGWNDGDGFFTSYILHPMEGSAAGFIERQNDPRYRDVEFGKSQRYWISCMRALAFSTAYAVAWSGSPLGEAGLGNVELHNKPGVVDLVFTQTAGLGWMIGEDAIDRYVIRRIEWHVRNPIVRAMARSFLNPTRSYARLMTFDHGWKRDDRPGVIYDQPPPSDFEAQTATEKKFSASAWPERTAFEFMASPIYERYSGQPGSNCFGAGGEGALKVAGPMDVAFDMDGCELYGLVKNVTGDTLNYTAGPRWRFETGTKWTPFIELLMGGAKIAHVTYHPEQEQQLWQETKQQHKTTPNWNEYHSTIDTNGFTLLAHAGIDYRVSGLVSWRVGSLGFQRSWMLDRLDGLDYNQGLRFSTGIAITMGPWSK